MMVEYVSAETHDVGERKIACKKRRHGRLVGGVKRRPRSAAQSRRLKTELQRWKALEIGRKQFP